VNAKEALFFPAFVPQFIEPGAPNKASGLCFSWDYLNFTGTVWCLFLAWSAAHLSRRAFQGSQALIWLTRWVVCLFSWV